MFIYCSRPSPMWSTHKGLCSTHALWTHAPSTWWLCHPPGPSQNLLLGCLLSANYRREERKERRREKRLRKYQVHHICAVPSVRTMSQGSNLIVKFRHEVFLYMQKEGTALVNIQTFSAILCIHINNSVVLECLPVSPSLAPHCNTHRTMERHELGGR